MRFGLSGGQPVLNAVKFFTWLGPSLVILASQAVAGTLSLTDLGTLGGSTSTGTAINNNGYAVGSSLTAGGATHAFEWNPNTQAMTDLGVLSGQTSSVANSINDNNLVGGQSGNAAFTGTPSALTSLGAGAVYSLNDFGVGIGETPRGSGGTYTASWNASNTQTNYFTVLGLNTEGTAIGPLGEFAGIQTTPSGTNGYYDSTGSTLEYTNNLGTFIPAQINGSNVIAGQDNGDHEAAIYTISTLTETILGKLSPSDASSTANGINSAGTVVGTSGNAGFEWTSSGGMVSLTSMLGSQYSGWTMISASAINDNGQILAEGSYNGGPNQAVILSLPTPEPSSIVLLGIAAIGLCVAAFKRRQAA